jgi:hypothetical protein
MWSGEARVMWRSSSGYTPQSMDGIIWRFCSWRGQPTPDLSRKDVHAFLGTSCHVNSSGSPQQKLGNGTCETRPGTYLPGTYRSLKLTTSSLDCFQSQQHPERSRCLSRRTSKFATTDPSDTSLIQVRRPNALSLFVSALNQPAWSCCQASIRGLPIISSQVCRVDNFRRSSMLEAAREEGL